MPTTQYRLNRPAWELALARHGLDNDSKAAAALHVTRQHYNAVKNGKRPATPDFIGRATLIFGADFHVHELFTISTREDAA